MEAMIERGLHNARTQAMGNARAAQDAKLRTSSMITHPGNGAGFRT